MTEGFMDGRAETNKKSEVSEIHFERNEINENSDNGTGSLLSRDGRCIHNSAGAEVFMKYFRAAFKMKRDHKRMILI